MKKLIVWASMLVLVFASAPSFANVVEGLVKGGSEASRGVGRAGSKGVRRASNMLRNGRKTHVNGRGATHGNRGNTIHVNEGGISHVNGRGATHGNSGAGGGTTHVNGSGTRQGNSHSGGEVTHGSTGRGTNSGAQPEGTSNRMEERQRSRESVSGGTNRSNQSRKGTAEQNNASTHNNRSKNGNRTGNQATYKPNANGKDLAAQNRYNRSQKDLGTPPQSKATPASAKGQTQGPASRATYSSSFVSPEELAAHGNFDQSVLAIPNVAVERNPALLEEGNVAAFSMTVIKTQEGEIFGVVATHALPDVAAEADAMFGVTKNFHAAMPMPDGTIKQIPAEVVQVSPVSMLDISLVKFDPQAEQFLQPFELRTTPLEVGESLFSPAFANGKKVGMASVVERESFTSLVVDRIDLKESLGICGSPWLDAEGKVCGINTGPGKVSNYGTKAAFINKLIDAYHHKQGANYDLVLDGHVLTELHVDEYISAYALLDENWNVIYKEDGLGSSTFGKYSETRLRSAMKDNPQGKYLVLHSRTPFWKQTENGNEFLIEDREFSTAAESNLREHVYDLQDQTFLYDADVNTGKLILEPYLDGQPIE